MERSAPALPKLCKAARRLLNPATDRRWVGGTRLHPSFRKAAGFPPCSLTGHEKMQLDNDPLMIFPNLRVFQCIPRHQPESGGRSFRISLSTK